MAFILFNVEVIACKSTDFSHNYLKKTYETLRELQCEKRLFKNDL